MSCQLSGRLGYWLLRAVSKRPPKLADDHSTQAKLASEDVADRGLFGAEKLERFLGRNVWQEFDGQDVLDFGCGTGAEAVAAAERGARRVVGLDIQEGRLQTARARAERHGVAERCRFLNPLVQADEVAELQGTICCAYSIDSFEHYDDPAFILQTIHNLLAPGGRLLVSFGPPWKNPYGGHMKFFCRLPWMHLLFSEETVMAVRALHRRDGARRYRDVDGGLNQMSLARFIELAEQSPLTLDAFRAVPLSTRFVNGSRWWQGAISSGPLREYFTAAVLCRLVRPDALGHHDEYEFAPCETSIV